MHPKIKSKENFFSLYLLCTIQIIQYKFIDKLLLYLFSYEVEKYLDEKIFFYVLAVGKKKPNKIAGEDEIISNVIFCV